MDRFEWMIDLAAGFNRYEAPAHKPAPQSECNGVGDRPGDDFNRRARWEDVIGGHGWRCVGQSGQKCYWKRPGKDEAGWSATTGYCKSESRGDLLYVFSTNAHPLRDEHAYSKFEVYAFLRHGGDFAAAARQLRSDGYGATGPTLLRNGVTTPPEKPDAENSQDPLDQDATAADLIAARAVIRWCWENWLPIGSLTILASEPGIGKTRFCGDLLRRAHNGLSWPDGAAQTCPPGSRALWIAADNQHAELGSMPGAFGFPPEVLFLNTTKRNPFGGTMLDLKEDLRDLERRILRVQPAFVFIDTCLNATDRTAHKPEDAKAFFVPLQQIAVRTQSVIVCVTHLNAAGKPLGRRIEGQGRVVIMLEKPDPEHQEHRRKLYVRKSHSLYPPPLGMTMGANGNEYDTAPPESPQRSGPRLEQGQTPRLLECMRWLEEYLAQIPKRVTHTRTDSETAGYSSKTLYAAKKSLDVYEFERGGYKWWQLPRPEDRPGDD